MNILISVNRNYLEKAKTMLYSLRLQHSDDITVFLLNHCLDNLDIEDFKLYLKSQCNIECISIDMTSTELDDLPVVSSNFSVEMYYRILAQFVLPNYIDRIVWLDADIIALKSLTEFYNQDFCGKYYVVCGDIGNDSDQIMECKRKLGLPNEYLYFNSGVLLMNIKLLREKTSKDAIIKSIKDIQCRITFPDQDILNYLYASDILYNDWKIYNFQTNWMRYISRSDEKVIVLLHYAGLNKPWNYKTINGTSRFYWKIRIRQGYLFEAVVAYCLHLVRVIGLAIRDILEVYFNVKV